MVKRSYYIFVDSEGRICGACETQGETPEDQEVIEEAVNNAQADGYTVRIETYTRSELVAIFDLGT